MTRCVCPGVSIEQQALAEGILPQRVIEESVALRANHGSIKESCTEQVRKQFQEELKAAVDEMRDVQIEMQKQLLERDRRIAQLEAQLAAKVQQQNTSVSQEDTPQPQTQPKLAVESVPEAELCRSCITWEQFATAVGRNRSRLLAVAKHWSASERATLPPLLATYLEEKPSALDETLTWVSPNLLKAALLHLTFTVQGISGCRFLSLEHLGSDSEQWIFEDRNNRLIPLFGRVGFAIECF